jgi:DNA-binding LacI/PurR family transcriptional regulator
MNPPEKGRSRAVSVKDVANLARVSPKTVSNVVHGIPRVTAETRDRVLWAIDQLGYRPNLAARNLRRGRTGIIALAVPELHVPYFAELATYVIDHAQSLGYTVLVDQTERDRERELTIVEGTVARLVDGIILSPLAITATDMARRRDATPMVLLGERVAPGLADHVAIDNTEAARLAASHLLSTGRRRIAVIGAQSTDPVTAGGLRLTGFRQAMAAAGVPVEESLVVPAVNFFRHDGAAAMTTLLSSSPLPDAVFCFNDLMAIGALRVLHDHGLRVPDDVAVVGFDDIEEGLYTYPRLTTVAPDKEAIARESLRMLNERIEGDQSGPRQIILSSKLVVRESA